MKGLLLAFVVLAQLAGCGTGSPTARPVPQDTADRVGEVDRARFGAMVGNDLEKLTALLADDLVYIHTSGEIESKPQFLQRLRSGSLRYRSIEPTNVRVRTYGNTAVVTGRSHMAVTTGGSDREFEILYTAVYTANGGRWQLASWQSTRIQP
jgi:ketosteroid isomerase-like protein